MILPLNIGAVLKRKYGGKKMHISEEGIRLIKHFEGCELEAYQCAAGVWTCGWGSTKGVKQGDVWTQEKADFLLEEELEVYCGYVKDAVKVPLNQCQLDSLTSWVYNLGNGSLKSSTLLKVLNSGDYEGVPEQILRWNKANGQVLEGLTRRRRAEALLFQGKTWDI